MLKLALVPSVGVVGERLIRPALRTWTPPDLENFKSIVLAIGITLLVGMRLSTICGSFKKRTTTPLQIAATLAAWSLTASLTTLNVLIGLGIALLLPPITLRKTNRGNPIAMLRLIPSTSLQGIREGLTLPLQGLRSRPDVSEDPWPDWAQRDPLLRFSWLVMVSFTPKTLVLETKADTVKTHLEKVS